MTEDERVELSGRATIYTRSEGKRPVGYNVAFLSPYKFIDRLSGLQISNATGRVFFYHRYLVPVIECTSDQMAMDVLKKLRVLQVLDTLARI